MFRKSARSVLVLAVLTAAGCASVPGRDVAMDDARMAVNAARSNPRVASYAPAELNQAIDTLRQAEDLAARGGRGADVQQLALLANQRASLAPALVESIAVSGRTHSPKLEDRLSWRTVPQHSRA